MFWVTQDLIPNLLFNSYTYNKDQFGARNLNTKLLTYKGRNWYKIRRTTDRRAYIGDARPDLDQYNEEGTVADEDIPA